MGIHGEGEKTGLAGVALSFYAFDLFVLPYDSPLSFFQKTHRVWHGLWWRGMA